jgi:predicted O-methyltransferase YrrM
VITNKKIEDYISRYHTAPDELLTLIERETHLTTLSPIMLSGHLQGSLLTLLSKLIKPRRILEIGTFTGYSALCFAEGLTDDGLLYTLEYDAEVAHKAAKFFAQSNKSQQIKLIVGDAKESLKDLNEDWDLVFIDADKAGYPAYYEMIVNKLKPGALILADNVLWKGLVANETMDKKTKVIHDFNVMVNSDPRVTNVIIPLRDGIHMILKN